jgi:hypothetical protein
MKHAEYEVFNQKRYDSAIDGYKGTIEFARTLGNMFLAKITVEEAGKRERVITIPVPGMKRTEIADGMGNPGGGVFFSPEKTWSHIIMNHIENERETAEEERRKHQIEINVLKEKIHELKEELLENKIQSNSK